LAQRARTDLEQLLETLQQGQITHHKGWEEKIGILPQTLKNVVSVANKCIDKVKSLQKGKGRAKR